MLSFIEILKAILFGIVEGITEWLPVSSTGHMILLNEFVHMNVSEEFWDMFLVVIQLGAILAVVLLFWKQIWPFNFTGRSKTNGIVKKDIMKMWFKIIVACIPAAVVGLLFDFVENLPDGSFFPVERHRSALGVGRTCQRHENRTGTQDSGQAPAYFFHRDADTGVFIHTFAE